MLELLIRFNCIYAFFDSTARSPVFSHLAATLTGLSTIRAFDAQDILIQEFDTHQDLHSGAWYMFITASSAFGFALDMLCLIFIFMVVFSFLSFNTGKLKSLYIYILFCYSFNKTSVLSEYDRGVF